ncbi:MAG: hypothetical protein ACREQY_01095 [Candidatus Binatia bacterium]
MADDLFSERKKSLEEEFFARQNEKLKRELRDKEQGKARKDALAAASGIQDERVLERLVAIDIGPEALAALSLVPLVQVVWADGSIDEKERAAVFAAAEKQGLARGEAAYRLLEGWLTERPREELMTTWKEYAAALAGRLGEDERKALREEIVGRARLVAEAAGGLLGFGSKVSKAEEAVLRELEQALS